MPPSDNSLPIKVLIFAHVPPPHHGQSYMVQLMLAGFRGDQRKTIYRNSSTNSFNIACYHVDARISKNLEDIGDFRLGKFLLLIGYCLRAIRCRFRHGVNTLYYVPAPGKSSALYRDWLVMFLCRPFFKHVILHWHAAGLAKWLETVGRGRTRSITFNLMKHVDLSIVLSNYNRSDAEKLFPKRIQIVSNGIPDPCPAFETDVWPRRKARSEARARLLSDQKLSVEEINRAGGDPHIFKVLYLAHCMTEKGLFDTISGVLMASQKLSECQSPISLHLTIAGNFVTAEERAEFDRIIQKPGTAEIIRHAGFVSGAEKERLLRESDLLCFPTFYLNENQPVNLIEAMAFGLPIITTRWRSLAEMFPKNYPGLIDIHSPEQIADALCRFFEAGSGEMLRALYRKNFSLERYLAGIAEALKSIQRPAACNSSAQTVALLNSPRAESAGPPRD